MRNKTGAYIPNYPDRGRFNRELVRNKTGAYIPNYPDRGRSLGSTATELVSEIGMNRSARRGGGV